MRRAILFILFGILLNTMDRVFSGEIQNPILIITDVIYQEPDYDERYYMDKKCDTTARWSVSHEDISRLIGLDLPLKFILIF